MVTEHRNPILIENIHIIKTSFINTIKIYKYKLIAYNIQPNHIHCIIKPKNISDYSKIIKSFKYSFTKEYKNKNRILLKIWQNRFYEHTIRDEKDMNVHLDYIHYNSMKHNKVAPQNWEYSSFEKYVKRGMYDINWCNYSDINNIKALDFE